MLPAAAAARALVARPATARDSLPAPAETRRGATGPGDAPGRAKAEKGKADPKANGNGNGKANGNGSGKASGLGAGGNGNGKALGLGDRLSVSTVPATIVPGTTGDARVRLTSTQDETGLTVTVPRGQLPAGFTVASASSPAAAITGATGAKISSRQTGMSGVTSTTTVGR